MMRPALVACLLAAVMAVRADDPPDPPKPSKPTKNKPVEAAKPAPAAAELKVGRVWLDFLKEEGYVPRIEDGDIVFKKEGRTYYILLDQNDPTYFRLVFPGFWKIDNDAERDRAYRAANTVNRSVKNVKVYITNKDSVWASVELLFGDEKQAGQVLELAMTHLGAGALRFADEMKVKKD